jgi:hypothetical protein
MDSIIVKKFKWFWAWQDEQEEKWLRDMSLQGYHLKKAGFFGSYEFEMGEPVDYIYRLDFNASTSKNLETYLQLFNDAGWDYLGNLGGWQYFRIKAFGEERQEIFNDNESKIQKYYRLVAGLTIFFPVYLIDMIILSKYDSVFMDIVLIIFTFVIILFSIAIFFLIRRIGQLKNNFKLIQCMKNWLVEYRNSNS